MNFDSEESLPSANTSSSNENQSACSTMPTKVASLTTTQPTKRQRKQVITKREDFWIFAINFVTNVMNTAF